MMKLLPISLILIILLGACTNGKGLQNQQINGQTTHPQISRLSETVTNLRELIIDVVKYSGCDYIQNRIMLLSPAGAESTGESGLVSGVIWIRDCSITQIDRTRIKVEISGIGWRWVEREIEAAGGTFAIDQNVRFTMSLSTVGTFDMAYSPDQHIVTVWFVPTEDVDVLFTVRSAVDIDTTDLWSSIVGTAAGVVGQTPEERAEERISRIGSRSIRAKLTHGFTVVWDLCTGKRYTKFGSLEAGKIPEIAAQNGDRNYEVNTRMILDYNTILMAGPFENENYIAEFSNVSQGGFEAYWLCQEEAQRIAQQYVDGIVIGEINALKREVIRQGQQITFEPPAGTDCSLVLLTRPIGDFEKPVSFDTKVYATDQQEKEPLVDCE